MGRHATISALVLGAVLGSLAPAAAQTRGNDQVALPPVELGLKYKFSLKVSAGLDLDVFGEVVTPAVSCDPAADEGPTACFNQTRIIEVGRVLHYPNVYASTPIRFHASAGFGIFQKDELIVQVSRNRSAAEPGLRVGRLVSVAGDRDLLGTFTDYQDTSIEGGLRHYFKAVGPSRKYVTLTFGRRTVEAITATLVATGADGNLGTVRFYDKANVKTAAIVFGVTYEPWKPIGFFLEAGFRWTERLPRNDDDLRPLALTELNNAGPRIFMPANLGVVVRF